MHRDLGVRAAGRLRDYVPALIHHPGAVISGTALDVVGVGAFPAGWKLGKLCMSQVSQFDKPHCFIGPAAMAGVGAGFIAAGTTIIGRAEK